MYLGVTSARYLQQKTNCIGLAYLRVVALKRAVNANVTNLHAITVVLIAHYTFAGRYSTLKGLQINRDCIKPPASGSSGSRQLN